MCSMSVLCPLCAQTSFASIDALRSSLIKAANGPLPCPICHEYFLGLDKLTIHLFSHTTLMTATTAATMPSLAAASAISSSASATGTSSEPTLTATKNDNKSKKIKKTKSNIQIDNKLPLVQQQFSTQPAQLTTTNCDICEFSFRNEELRDMHFRLVHQCLPHQANALISNNNNINNNNANSNSTNEPFKCHLCSKTFKSKGSLRVHLKVAHLMGLPYVDNTTKLNICERLRHKCETSVATTTITAQQSSLATIMPINTTTISATPKTFSIGTLTLLPNATTDQQQQNHQQHQQPSVININTNGELLQSSDVATLGSNVLLVFNTNTAQHQQQQSQPQQHHQQQHTQTYDTYDYDSLSKSINDNPKIWECDICSKSFTTKYFLKKHKRLHTGEMPYTCEICSRTFTFQQSYHKHLLYHSEVKPHVCATCGRAFKELSTLHNHERIHSGEKPFKCEVCDKSFRQRVSFLVHTRIHTGVMPYKCDVCEKSFRYKVSQRTHKCLQAVSPTTSPITTTTTTTTQQTANDDADHLTDNFIKAFLERATTSVVTHDAQNSPASAEIAAINGDDAQLVKTIDDIVAETCEQMGIASQHSTQILNTPISNTAGNGLLGLELSDGSNSPSQQLQKMRLYSPQLVSQLVDTTGDNSCFDSFLMDSVAGNSLL